MSTIHTKSYVCMYICTFFFNSAFLSSWMKYVKFKSFNYTTLINHLCVSFSLKLFIVEYMIKHAREREREREREIYVCRERQALNVTCFKYFCLHINKNNPTDLKNPQLFSFPYAKSTETTKCSRSCFKILHNLQFTFLKINQHLQVVP